MGQLFNKDEVFDTDYAYFYEVALLEQNVVEAKLIESLLDLPLDSYILDSPCGNGRITNLLASFGYNLYGVDSNKEYLTDAKIEAEQENLKVKYYQSDIRTFKAPIQFDAIINWHNSFGYFDDLENRELLKGFYDNLQVGGKLLIEQVNRDRILKLLLPGGALWTDAVFRDNNMMIDRVRYTVETGRMDVVRISLKDGKLIDKLYSFRIFTFPELKDWLLSVGFRNIQVFGEDGEPFNLDSKRMIVIAEKR